MPVSVAAYVPRFGIALATFALLAGAAFAGETGDKIPVRAADHGDYGRIVFDWNGPVGHSVTVVGRELTVAFDKPMDGSFESVLRWLKVYVSAARLEDAPGTAGVSPSKLRASCSRSKKDQPRRRSSQ